MNIPQTYGGKPLVHSWEYRAPDGSEMGHVCRYQINGSKKDIVPFFKRNGSGWMPGIDLTPRPLFGLDKLANHPKDKAVFIVEGEKSAAALHSLGIVAITSLGGAQAANKADWMPLSGFKSVYLLPDADPAGEHYMQDVYGALMDLESPPTVKIVRLPDLPAAGDVIDWLQNFSPDWDGYTAFPDSEKAWAIAELRAELKKAESVPEDWGFVGFVGSDPKHSDNFSWDKPIEIITQLKPVSRFEVGLLPNAFALWAKDIAWRMQCPSDYVGVTSMIALSAVVGKKGIINPRKKDNWTVCPNLWGLNIGRPSAMKTPAASEALKPLQRLEIKAKEAFVNAKAEDEAQGFINAEGRALAEKAAKSMIKDSKFAQAKQILMENPAETKKPTRARFMVNDVTIEKLGEVLNENPNGLLMYRDEISGFLKTIDREDHTNDRAFYLETFTGLSPYTFDRIGRGTIDIESTCVALLGNIQPGVLRAYLNQAINGAAGDDGMFQRFQMMVWPDLDVWQPIDQWPDKGAKEAAYAVFTRLANWEGFKEPARFSHDAQALFDDWFKRLHLEVRSDDIRPAIESHYAKYKSLIPSLAVLIHLADDSSHSAIVGIDAIKKAIAWSDYLKSHAERVYSSALDPTDANAKTILTKIESGRLVDNFSAGDILRGGWTGLDSLDNVKSALTRLIDYGWLRQTITRPEAGTGRPSIRYQVNPIIFQKR
ncbi:MAG: DUF3987 domain-containing protein [Methylobacter sp.]